MRVSSLLGIAAGLAVIGGAGRAYANFLRDMEHIRDSLETLSRVADTASGPIEYARQGRGHQVLMIHGAGGGYDQGLLLGREMFGGEADVIAPSRFGYLRTPVPADGSPAAQADAHAALLDALEIERTIVVGVSAGAPSAVEMALRHPSRVAALVLVVPRLWSPEGPMGVEKSAQSRAVLELMMRGADFGYWLAMRVARTTLVRFLGVPPELEAKAPPADRARVSAIIRSILPLSARLAGLENDGAATIEPWPLERIVQPTLIVAAEDDLFRSLPGARLAAEQIPGAELVVFATGGHLLLGRGDEVRKAIRSFLERHPTCALRVAA